MKKFKKFMTVFLAIVMCVSSVLSVSATDTSGGGETTTNLTAPEEGKILFSTDFTESNPFRVVGNGSIGTIRLVTDSDTTHGQALEIKKTTSGDLRIDSGDDASPKFTFTSDASSIVYEFDVKIVDLTNTAFNFNVRKKVNGSNTYAYPCKITGGKLQAGEEVVYDSLSADTWYKVAVVQNYATGCRDVYLDGVKVSTDNSLEIESAFDKETGASDALRLAIEARGSAGDFRVDNIRIYEGTVPLNDESQDSDSNLRTPVEGTILFSTDFAESNPFRAVGSGSKGTIGLVTDNDTTRGQVLEITRTTSGDLRIDTGDDANPKITTFTSNASSIVYEFDVKIADLANTVVNFNVRKKVDGSSKYAYPCKITNGVLSDGSGINLGTLTADTWYKVSVVQNYATGYRDIYLDGKKVSTDNTQAIEVNFDTTTGASDALRVAIEARGSADNFRVDNIKIYEGTVPLADESQDFDSNLRAPVEGTILFSTDFAEANPFRAVGSGSKGTIGLVTDGDSTRGQALEIKRTTSGDLRIDSGDDASPKFTFTSDASSIVYEFDVKIADVANTIVNFNVRKKVDGSSKYAYPCKITNGVLSDGSGSNLGTLTADTWYKVSVVQNYATGYRDIYLDGTKVSTDNTQAIEANFDTITGASDALRVAIEARGSADNFRVDNIRIYEGTVPLPISSEGGNEGGEGDDGDEGDTTITLRDPVEGTKIYATDFETHNPFKGVTTGGTVTRVTDDEEHNTVVEMQRTTTGDLRLDPTASSFSTDSNSVVYEFDVKLLDVAEKSGFHLLLRKASDTSLHGYVCTISGGKVFGYRGTTEVASLNANTWYTVSVVQNYKTMYRDIYIDGEKVSIDNTLTIEEQFTTGTTDLDRVKFESTSTSTSHFMLDNVRVYEGTRPYSGELLEKAEEEVVITIDPTKTVFEGEGLKNLWGNVYLDTLLDGYVALHTRSGLVYKAGNKTLLAATPVATAEGFDVVLSEICEALELTYSVSGNTATVNGQTVAVSEKDGKVWVDAEVLLGTYGVVSIDTNENIKSNGVMIAGATAFSWPSDEDTAGADLKTLGSRSMLQNLNEYLFLEQPTAADITTLYEASAAKGEHPRVQATKEDFDRIKRESQTNEYVSNWYQQIIAAADYLVDVNTVPLTYEFRDGVRLLYVSRDMLDHMYTLGMAYQLTGEQKYVNRAWIDLEAVAGFPDWHPQHGLDTVEMSAAVAIGYDWMYHGLTEKQRTVVEKGMYKHAFTVACSGYQAWGNTFCSSVLQDGNQNFVVNAGFTMGALAMMDVYPEESAFITSGAIRAIGGMMIEFGPDGAWNEGPNYWEYSMQYTSKMLSSLECVFGTCFSLDKCEGLSTAGNYFMHVQSDRGRFNYGDGGTDNLYVPEIFYLADKYDNKALMTTLLNVNHGEMLNCEDVVLSLLWYDDSASEGTTELPIDGVYWTEGVATFRDAWTDGVTAFAGIHGGKTNVMHAQIDGGTFVYDYAGIRWAVELGSSPYSTSVSSNRAEDGGRWLLYRSKAEAHNTLVINPVDGTPEQKVGSTAKLLRFDKENKGAIAVLDLTENYADNATSAIRGMFFTDDRTSLVVRDEIKLSKADSTIYWFMHTEADVEIAADGKSATLTQDSQQVTLEFTTTGSENAELSYGPSTRALLGTTSPLAGTSEANADEEATDVNRIYIKLSGASGDVTITAKLTPANVNSTPISDYDKSIALWTIPEGEIAAKPEVQSVVIEGREIAFDDANKATFLCVEGKYDTVPVPTVTVDESKFTYEVTNATTTDSGVTTIIVKDKANLTAMTSYTIAFEEIPVAAVPAGFTGTALQVVAVEASDEPQAVPEGYVAWRVLDQDTDTRWTSKGIGNWILLELEEEASVDNMIILFKNGNVRYTYFNVSVSTDGENFEMVYSGESGGPAIGSVEAYEQFSLGGKTAKYIKIGCNGNSKQGIVFGWNNIGEVVFTGTIKESEPTPTPTVAPTEAPTATPAPSAEPTSTPTPSTEPTTSPVPETVEIVADKTDESYTLGTNGTVTIYCTGELDELERVEVDGVEVDKSNYTLVEGSTILTFNASYLDTLAPGEHAVKLIYTGDRSVVTTLAITEKVVVDDNTTADDDTDDEVSNDADDNSIAAPDVDASATPTGDSNHLTLWMILAIAAFTGAAIYGIIYRKKFK